MTKFESGGFVSYQKSCLLARCRFPLCSAMYFLLNEKNMMAWRHDLSDIATEEGSAGGPIP